MCRWHVLLDVSRFWTMATLSVQSPATKPIGTQSVGELPGMQDNVRRLHGFDGTEEYSVWTQW
jgi:hypothetical protein